MPLFFDQKSSIIRFFLSLPRVVTNACPEMILPYDINIDPIVVEEGKKDSNINKYFSQDPRNKVIKI